MHHETTSRLCVSRGSSIGTYVELPWTLLALEMLGFLMLKED